MTEPDIRTTREGIVFSVYVQPKASANAVLGLHEDAMKIRLTAPPIDNAANKMCIKFLSRQMKIPASRMEIVSGHTSRQKKILIRFEDPNEPKASGPKIIEQIKALLPDAQTTSV